jgi:hypothetical protein
LDEVKASKKAFEDYINKNEIIVKDGSDSVSLSKESAREAAREAKKPQGHSALENDDLFVSKFNMSLGNTQLESIGKLMRGGLVSESSKYSKYDRRKTLAISRGNKGGDKIK